MTPKDLYKTIEKKEWQFILVIMIITIILTFLPYIYGWIIRGDSYFLGIHSLSPGDISVYYSYIEQVKQGNFLFNDLYTSEPQNFKFLNVFWLGVGFLAKIFHLPNAFAFHLARLILIPIFLIIAYLFLSYFFSEKIKRKIGLIFLLFASGVGGLLTPILEIFFSEKVGYYYWPLDLWVPESNTFLTLYQSPHLIASLILIIVIFLLMLLALENNKIKYSLGAGLAGLFLFQFHPFHIFLIFGVLGIYISILFFIQRDVKINLIKHYFIFGLLSAPSIFYHLYLLNFDWLTIERARQNICLTPPFYFVIIGYGFLLFFAVLGIYFLFRAKEIKNYKYFFLVTWSVFQLLLIYFPFNFQRRFVEGLQVPLSLLAIIGLFFLYSKIKNKKILFLLDSDVFLVFIFVFFLSFSNLFIIFNDLNLYRQKFAIFYISFSKKETFNWLKDNIEAGGIIFSHPFNGNLIPGQTGAFVYSGHGVETALSFSKVNSTAWFLKNNISDQGRIKFFKKNNIRYLFWGSEEKKESQFKPEEKDYLKEVYQNKDVVIYRVL